MPRYHISEKTDRPNICRAQPGNCPLRTPDGEPPHFNSKEEAKAHIEEKNAEKYSEVASTQKKAHSKEQKKAVQSSVKYVSPRGDTCWEKDGKLHREDGPALEYYNGSKEWYKNGQLHREDGPAAEYADGTKEWWKNGKRHREDGPAFEFSDGTKEWYRNGELHREDGPAIDKPNWHREWYKNGQLHREDGPAVEYPDGSEEWWINGREVSR